MQIEIIIHLTRKFPFETIVNHYSALQLSYNFRYTELYHYCIKCINTAAGGGLDELIRRSCAGESVGDEPGFHGQLQTD